MKKNKKTKKVSSGTPPLKTVTTFIKPYRSIAILLVILTIASTIISLITPKYIGYIFDAAAKREDYTDFTNIIILIIIVSFVIGLLQIVIGSYLSQKVAYDIRVAVSTKISKQSFKFINQITPSKLLSILTSDVDAVRDMISQSLVVVISSIFLIIGAASLMFSINWRMTLAALLVVPSVMGAFVIVFKKLGPLFEKTRIVIDSLNRVISESVIAASLIRVLNSQNQEETKINEYNLKAKDLGYKILSAFAFMFPFINFVASFFGVVVLYVGGNEFLNQRLSPGDFISFFTYLGVLIFPVLTLGFISNVISRAFVSVSRINEVLDSKVEKVDGTIEKEIKGEIEFKNVSLVLSQKYILKDVSFKINPNKRSAIIGPTAAGKTQIMYLLTGLIEPTEGEILIDGVNIKEYNLDNLYSQMGIVFQDSIIFNTTIEENIDFKNVNKDLQKVITVSELNDFLSSLNDGFNTQISERGSNLSGGQKQRLTLARALSINPKILLLDDFTARIDKATEQRIFENLKKEYPDLTSLVISQKIESIKDFDQIILIMEGEVLAKGTHEQLLKNSLEYNQIYQSQQSTDN